MNTLGDIHELAGEIEAPVVYLVPSRGRPRNVRELLDAWAATLSPEPFAELVIALDVDDPELMNTLEAAGDPAGELPEWAHIIVGPRLRLGGTLNALGPPLAVDRLAVGFMGDDHRPRTPGWDRTVFVEHVTTRGAVVYGNDLIQGKALPTAVSIAGDVVETLGYYVPPGMVHLYLDNYWRELGTRLGTLRYLPELVIEHCHPIAGTAPNDDRYAEVNAPEVYSADEDRYRRYLAEWFGADVERARAWIERRYDATIGDPDPLQPKSPTTRGES